MLPFFRKIRWRLAENNQFLKYSRYAIGEIVLVVIGILIALQINNWNEQRQERALELQLLKAFEAGLEKDLDDMDGNIFVHQRGIRGADRIISFLEGEASMEADTFGMMMADVLMPTLFVYSTSAFETLKSKGVSIVRNDTLRDQIIEVYDSRYRFFIDNENLLYQAEERFVQEVLPLRFEDSYGYTLNPPDFDGMVRPLDPESLKSDQEFLYHFKSFRNRLIVHVDWQYAELRRRVVRLQKNIVREIETLEAH